MKERSQAGSDKPAGDATPPVNSSKKPDQAVADKSGERGGPKGPEPTRFGDWESNGRCTDF